jgi:hypothetical protein
LAPTSTHASSESSCATVEPGASFGAPRPGGGARFGHLGPRMWLFFLPRCQRWRGRRGCISGPSRGLRARRFSRSGWGFGQGGFRRQGGLSRQGRGVGRGRRQRGVLQVSTGRDPRLLGGVFRVVLRLSPLPRASRRGCSAADLATLRPVERARQRGLCLPDHSRQLSGGCQHTPGTDLRRKRPKQTTAAWICQKLRLSQRTTREKIDLGASGWSGRVCSLDWRYQSRTRARRLPATPTTFQFFRASR